MAEFKSFFKVVGGNEGGLCRYNVWLDTYGRGCKHDCAYCYAKSLLSFRGMWNAEAPAVASLDAIQRRIDLLKRQGFKGVLRLGGMTDCLQPAESQRHVTRTTIAMLNRARIPYLIVTKSHLIASHDYLNILDPELAHVQVSVTNTNDGAALEYEKCSLSSKRISAVRRLEDADIDVALRLSPFVSEWIDPRVVRGVDKCVVEFLRVNHWIEKWLGGRIDLSPYSLKSGGYRHLPLEEKRQRLEALVAAMPGTTFTVCEDVPDHYDFWKKSFNPSPDDCCNLRK